jgi:RNA polymerase subunit RPABC4/transcription elongation factor Spt4
MRMFCKYCAAEMDDGAKFCPVCGKPQQAQPAASSSGDGASGKAVCVNCGKSLERDWLACPFCVTLVNEATLDIAEKSLASAKQPLEKAGLYDGDEYRGPLGLMDSIDWITAQGQDGGNYRIVLEQDEAIPYAILQCEGKQVSVSLKSSGPERTVQWEGKLNKPLFEVRSGATFILEEGIALVGAAGSNSSVVLVGKGGTFNMSGGSISGNSAKSSPGGGVLVVDGTFNMSGGSISGNSANRGGGVFVGNGTFNMSGGNISENHATYGGGVFVSSSGTFIKSRGGVIYGSNAPAEQANTAGSGAAVFCVKGEKKRETTARIGTLMDSTKDGTAGGWE